MIKSPERILEAGNRILRWERTNTLKADELLCHVERPDTEALNAYELRATMSLSSSERHNHAEKSAMMCLEMLVALERLLHGAGHLVVAPRRLMSGDNMVLVRVERDRPLRMRC